MTHNAQLETKLSWEVDTNMFKEMASCKGSRRFGKQGEGGKGYDEEMGNTKNTEARDKQISKLFSANYQVGAELDADFENSLFCLHSINIIEPSILGSKEIHAIGMHMCTCVCMCIVKRVRGWGSVTDWFMWLWEVTGPKSTALANGLETQENDISPESEGKKAEVPLFNSVLLLVRTSNKKIK